MGQDPDCKQRLKHVASCTHFSFVIVTNVCFRTSHSFEPAEMPLQTTYCKTSTMDKTSSTWLVRPACPDDKTEVERLLYKSYSRLLKHDYPPDVLEKALPFLCHARHELLTCGTWYVVVGDDDDDDDDEEEGNDTSDDDDFAATCTTTATNATSRTTRTTQQIVGCGGYTLTPPKPWSKSDDTNVDTTGSSSSSSEFFVQTDRSTFVPNLRHFATDPDMARQGIASAIWERIISQINNNDDSSDTAGGSVIRPQPGLSSSKTIMEVFSTITGRAFYESLGFQKVDDVTIPFSDDCLFPAILMRRRPDQKGRDVI
jgi:GNAT superfamily N-acetyltransferase